MKTRTFCATLLLTPVCFLNLPLLAQPAGPGGDPDAEIPIDGGIGLLIAAGVAYGAKRAYDNKKKEKERSL